jgi:GntR family transcriptional repressor for pyruvate dehydrogenase complex
MRGKNWSNHWTNIHIKSSMNLQAVKPASLADQVFAQLLGEVLHGAYLPGSKLPAERKLSEVFEVNRHVVREALKRLEQVGVLRISQGGSTEVLNFRKTAGLDLLGLMAEYPQGQAQKLKNWRANLEMRAAIATDAARLCAERRSQALASELLALTEQMQATENDAALFALEVRYWDTLLEGADNMAYQLAFNSMMKSLRSMPAQALSFSMREVRASRCHQALSEAIARRDADAAEQDTRTLMRQGLVAFKQLSALMENAA